MVVLRAIGRFFAKIGRWIRDTAWVQPLLIVGGIFAIIFSIPYITKWVKSWGGTSTSASEKFYNSTKLSLKGVDEEKSDVDSLFKYLLAVEDNDQEGIEAGKKKYGEKFFLCFVQQGCSGCETNYEGLNYLKSNFTTKDAESELYLDGDFKYHSIYIDQIVDGLDYDNIFDHFILENYQQVFESVAGVFSDEQNYSYLINKGGKSSDYHSNISKIAESTIESPTIFLFDISATTKAEVSTYGITEVLFTADGKDGKSTPFSRAQTLADCWNHEDMFSQNYKG